MKRFLSDICTSAFVISQIIVCISCNEKMSRRVDAPATEISNTDSFINIDSLYHFDLNNKTIVQSFDDGDTQERYKFVQVQVTEVVNPNKHPVTFEVHYKTTNKEKLLLGSFSLYPSDNPGRFIVPTQGKLQRTGSIILSLVIPKDVPQTGIIKVTTTKIKLVKE